MAEADNPEAAVGQLINGESTTVELFTNHEVIQVTAGELG